jgi:ribonuclease P protein component
VSSGGVDARFGKAKRLLDAKAYTRVFDGTEGKASHKHLLLLARRNGLGGHRLGLVVAKKNVRLAVQRNRIKRITREFFRTLPPGSTGMDVVLIARRGIDQLENAELSTILRQQWQRLGRRMSSPESSTEQIP